MCSSDLVEVLTNFRQAQDIKRLFKDSTGEPLPISSGRKDAPNVVVVLLDDVGFGSFGTFGGPVPTPTCDLIAEQGLRYNQFHTTALCAPTRAALLTGRNHHTVHMGCITEAASSFPGYDSVIPDEADYQQRHWGEGYETELGVQEIGRASCRERV